MKTFKQLFLYFILLIMIGCTNSSDVNNTDNSTESSVQRLSYSVVGVYPHDTSSFTQGLTFYKGKLIEGTGNEGKSKLMHIDIKTGKPVKEVALNNTYFG